jgi:hypothetical protein
MGWVFHPGNTARLAFEVLREDEINPYSQDKRLGMLAPAIRWSLNAGDILPPAKS